jgi:hypothetical protein
MRLKGTCVLVLGVFAFAVPAYAGNENGNGNGNGNGKGNAGASDVAPAPGNSANAPGQQKQDAAAPVETTTTAVVTTTTVAASASEGVKPSNNTEHETHAQAQSQQTKLYGNGQTAGQIAMKHGASGSTVLHGPGNSQPHGGALLGWARAGRPRAEGSARRELRGEHADSAADAHAVGSARPSRHPAGARDDRRRSGTTAGQHGRRGSRCGGVMVERRGKPSGRAGEGPADRPGGVAALHGTGFVARAARRNGADCDRAGAPANPNGRGCRRVRA